jgi:hypothetical protein
VVSMTVAVGGREKRSLTEQSFAKIWEYKPTFCLEYSVHHVNDFMVFAGLGLCDGRSE